MEWQPIEQADKKSPIMVPEMRGKWCIPRVAVWMECPYLGSIVGEAWRPIDDPQRALNPEFFAPLPEPPQKESL